MKKLNIKWMLSLIAAFTFASCDTDVDHDIPAVDTPVLVSTTPESGAAKVKTGEITIEVKYDKNIFFATDNLSEIKFTGGELISADVLGASNILTVKVNVPGRETACSLSIPEGIVTGPNQMPAPAVSVQFSTVALDKALVTASSAKAVKLYNYPISSLRTQPAWRTTSATCRIWSSPSRTATCTCCRPVTASVPLRPLCRSHVTWWTRA